jgi:hypothetical protein
MHEVDERMVARGGEVVKAVAINRKAAGSIPDGVWNFSVT